MKVIALLDDVPFDPRKRLFKTALSGRLGTHLAPDVSQLFQELGTLGALADGIADRVFRLPARLDTITDALCDAAQEQGFSVGLDKPDRRHVEK